MLFWKQMWVCVLKQKCVSIVYNKNTPRILYFDKCKDISRHETETVIDYLKKRKYIWILSQEIWVELKEKSDLIVQSL